MKLSNIKKSVVRSHSPNRDSEQKAYSDLFLNLAFYVRKPPKLNHATRTLTYSFHHQNNAKNIQTDKSVSFIGDQVLESALASQGDRLSSMPIRSEQAIDIQISTPIINTNKLQSGNKKGSVGSSTKKLDRVSSSTKKLTNIPKALSPKGSRDGNTVINNFINTNSNVSENVIPRAIDEQSIIKPQIEYTIVNERIPLTLIGNKAKISTFEILNNLVNFFNEKKFNENMNRGLFFEKEYKAHNPFFFSKGGDYLSLMNFSSVSEEPVKKFDLIIDVSGDAKDSIVFSMHVISNQCILSKILDLEKLFDASKKCFEWVSNETIYNSRSFNRKVYDNC